jgi:hypothetical protein
MHSWGSLRVVQLATCLTPDDDLHCLVICSCWAGKHPSIHPTRIAVCGMCMLSQTCPPGEAELCPRRDNSHSGNFVSFGCTAPTQYNDLATLFFNTQASRSASMVASSTVHSHKVAGNERFEDPHGCPILVQPSSKQARAGNERGHFVWGVNAGRFQVGYSSPQ